MRIEKGCGRECGDPCHKGHSGASGGRSSVGVAADLPWAFRPAAPPLILPAMDDRPKRTQKASQQRRLGAALRENLKRRKAQAKGRASAPGTDPKDDLKADDKSHDSAGIAGHKQRS